MVGFIVAAVIVVVLHLWWGLLALIPGWVAVFLVLWYVFRNAGKGDEEEDKDKPKE